MNAAYILWDAENVKLMSKVRFLPHSNTLKVGQNIGYFTGETTVFFLVSRKKYYVSNAKCAHKNGSLWKKNRENFFILILNIYRYLLQYLLRFGVRNVTTFGLRSNAYSAHWLEWLFRCRVVDVRSSPDNNFCIIFKIVFIIFIKSFFLNIASATESQCIWNTSFLVRNKLSYSKFEIYSVLNFLKVRHALSAP